MKYATESNEWMLQMVVQHGGVSGRVEAVSYKKRMEVKRKERLMAKPLHGRFFQGTDKDANGRAIAGPRSWDWVKSGYD